MHRMAVVFTALVTVLVAVWAMTVLNANPSHPIASTPGAASLDVNQMMRDAKNLPQEHYDAH